MAHIRMLLVLAACGAVACGESSSAAQLPLGGDGGGDNCEGRADQYFAGITKSSEDGTITAEISKADPAPPANTDKNNWTIKLIGADKAPIVGAAVIGAPFMIDHQHGSTNQMATDTGGGTYTLGPLAFTMSGLWEVTLKVTPAGATSPTKVVYSFCISPK